MAHHDTGVVGGFDVVLLEINQFLADVTLFDHMAGHYLDLVTSRQLDFKASFQFSKLVRAMQVIDGVIHVSFCGDH